MRRVAELLRVSTAAQAGEDRASIPSQKEINSRTSRIHGLTIVRTFEIVDVSGTAVLQSPELIELLEFIKDPEVHGVVAREFSRLMRPENFADYVLLQAFTDSQTLLYLDGSPPIDFSSKMGRVFGVMQAAFAGAQRVEFLENGWNSKERKRRDGEFPQSRICLPFGVAYDRSKGKDGWRWTSDSERVREAFRLLLSGVESYVEIGRKVNIDPYSLRVMLRNPVYTGTRVIDKRRDPSAAGRITKPNGRQADRKKIQRAPDDVIRVKVLEPLVSENQFARAQQIMDFKKSRHWRTQGTEHRFTYNGFLLCGECRGVIYTKYRRRDYYICKNRCGAPYMRREILDPALDQLLSEHLLSVEFITKVVRGLRKQTPQRDVKRVQNQVAALTGKRERILESYYDGTISKAERDSRLKQIEDERVTLARLLSAEAPSGLTVTKLAKMFRPLAGYAKRDRQAKRKILTGLTAEIVASNYNVKGIWIGHEVNHRDKDSSRQPA